MEVVNTEKEERTTQTIPDIEVYTSEIERHLADFCEKFNIDDLTKETQNRWNAALLYIYKHLFKDNTVLYKDNITNMNGYNIDNVYSLCLYYIDLCYQYDKECSISGFSKLSGINQDTIYSWGILETRSNSKASEVYKKLNKEREETLSNMLISGKRNPVGILGALNHYYAWNMPGVSGKDTQALAKQTPEQIANQYKRDLLPDNSEQLPPVDV